MTEKSVNPQNLPAHSASDAKEGYRSSDDTKVGPQTHVHAELERATEIKHSSSQEDETDEDELPTGIFRKLTSILLKWGVETHGITPVPPSKRTDKRIYQLFWVWFTCNFNILAFGTGSAGPAFFGLGIRDSLLILMAVDIVSCAVPAYFSVFGPKLGMRGMVQCRFSWGLYGGAIPSSLNVISSMGFLILNGIIGGQTIAAVSTKLNDTLGIVIIGVIASVITFCGYRVLHWFETYAWLPNLIAFPLLLGLGGKNLNPTTFPAVPPPSAAAVLSFASFVASSVVSWCTLTADYGVYHDFNASEQRIFIWTYLGFFVPSILWHMMGAAFAAAAPGIPLWAAGFDNGSNIGGLLMAVLAPAGGFGKFMLVLIALSTSGACAPTMYTFGLSAMAVAPFFARVPRYILVIISEAIFIPVAIIGAKRFYTTLVDVLSVIGYWSSVFGAIVLTEHFVFRRTWAAYDVARWDKARQLPPGIAAVLAFGCAFGIIVPSMSQTWYTGPIARAGSGDIGIFTGMCVGTIAYLALRSIERRVWPGR